MRERHDGNSEVIILLHGFASDSRYWKKLTPYLKRAGYRVAMIDLLGFGSATKAPASQYDYTEHIQHIHAFIKSLGLRGSFTLVGHSMGAVLAARYVCKYPNNVKEVYLLHPPLYKNADEAYRTLRATGRHYRYLLDSPRQNIGWKVMIYLPGVPVGKHSADSRRQSLVNVVESSELIADLERVKVKTVLLVGLRDRPEYLKNLAIIKSNKYVSIITRDVAHHSPLRKPKVVAQIIMDVKN